MKILHCSDLHLEGVYNAAGKENIRLLKDEALEIFAYIVSFAKEQNVEAVMICGDFFDRTDVRRSAIKFVFQQMESAKDIVFYFIKGNHDDKINLDFPDKPENFQIIGEHFMRFDLDEKVSIGGVSLSNQNVETFYNDIDFDPKRFNIFMLHADTMFGSHDPTNFCNVEMKYLKGKNINYLALGHIHKKCEGALDERGTYCNGGNCGNYGFGEEPERGFVLLDIGENSIQVKRHIIPLKRKFVTLSVDISKFQNEKNLEAAIERVLENQNKDDFVRIKFTGYFDESFDKRTEYLTSKFKNRFFYFDIRDESKMQIDLQRIREEKLSLKHEYLNQVFSLEELSEEDKNKIAYAGVQALRGEDITI